MWHTNPSKVELDIQQLKNGIEQNNSFEWEAQISLVDGGAKILDERITVRDPFNDADHNDVAEYLNKTLDQRGKFDESSTIDVSQRIDSYGKKLFDCLKLGSHLGRLKGKKIVIRVCEMKPGEHERRSTITSERVSIHRVQWEHLEHLSLWYCSSWSWNAAPDIVTVRQLFRGPQPRSLPRQRKTNHT